MSVSPELLKQLLRKHKEKTITAREMVLLRLYLSSSDAEETLDAVDFSDMPEASDEPETVVETRFQRILDKTTQVPVRTIYRKRWAAGIAAAVLITLGCSLLYLYTIKQSHPEEAATQITWRTGNGEIKQIILPDSSRVWLNARSVFSFPKAFEGKKRKVLLLQGQAFFAVTTDAERPFIVESQQHVQTRVLGTSFSVSTDSSDATVRVAVATGKVRVDREEKPVATLVPGDQVNYDIRASKAQLSKIDLASINGWTKGEVKLKQADFASMAATMKTMYGIEVMPGNTAVRQNLYSLTIRYGADVRKLMEVIGGINRNHCEWSKTDSTVVFIH
jgi:ferric-dicitrate binding protein FerR (iron transport regulator)